jgi:N-methylhydantoinase B
MLPDAALGCFAKAMPGGVQAEGSAAIWNLRLGGGAAITGDTNPDAQKFLSLNFQSGGMGGHPNHDGMSATAYPSGVKAIAIEVTEAMTPMVFWKRQLRENSAGAGKFRGGLGQSVEISSREGTPFALFAAYQRQIFPARGSDGGHDGAAGSFWLKGGGELGSRGKQIIPANEHLVIEIPGGGGLGNPAERDPAAVLKDVVSGLVSGEMARDIYKVAITDDLTVDEEGTRALREAG